MQIKKVSLTESRQAWEKLYMNNVSSPFQSWQYVNNFVKHFSEEKDLFILEVSDNSEPIVIFPFEKIDNTVTLLGMKQVLGTDTITDYGDIMLDKAYTERIEKIWHIVVEFLKKSLINTIIFENLKEDVLLFSVLKKQLNTVIEKQETAPFISLPATWDLYLEGLNRVERKELKRKLKRLESVPYSFSIHTANSLDVFQDFIRLHRLSNQNKKQFMVEKMEQFFWDIVQMKMYGWKISIAELDINGKSTAAILFFENRKECLLYNSGYDPEYKYYSNGLMLHALLIKNNIEKEIQIHDFLRGSERYKYDLGGKDKRLFKITVTV